MLFFLCKDILSKESTYSGGYMRLYRFTTAFYDKKVYLLFLTFIINENILKVKKTLNVIRKSACTFISFLSMS